MIAKPTSLHGDHRNLEFSPNTPVHLTEQSQEEPLPLSPKDCAVGKDALTNPWNFNRIHPFRLHLLILWKFYLENLALNRIALPKKPWFSILPLASAPSRFLPETAVLHSLVQTWKLAA